MRLLLFIALLSCSRLFAAEEYTFKVSVDADTKVYLVNGEPLFYHDTLIFDEDVMTLLGQGVFMRKFSFLEGTPFKNFKFILENPLKGYVSFPINDYILNRLIEFSTTEDTYWGGVNTSLPITINMGEVKVDLINSADPKNIYVDTEYHRTYSVTKKAGFNYFEDYLGSQVEFVLDEFGSNAPENEQYEVIPDLRLNCSIEETSKTLGYYIKYKYDLYFSLKDGDSTILTKSYLDNDFTKFESDNLNSRYWFISKIRSFIAGLNLEELRESYSASFEKTKSAWLTKKIPSVNQTNAKNTVVTIKGEYGHGSGVVISKSGYILTNYHVINNEEDIVVITNDGEELFGEVVRSNKKYDIALVKVTDYEFLYVAEIDRQKNRTVGTPVVCIGSPLSEHLDGSISEGFISGTYQKIGYEHYIVSANINPGNSGGGVFTEDGKLVGIVNAKIVGYSNHNIGFSIPIEVIKNELKISFE